jgi:AcrR family transcriptional regulator
MGLIYLEGSRPENHSGAVPETFYWMVKLFTGRYTLSSHERMTRYPSNRERLMEAAGELFYREGLHAITADRVADRAGLTKPTIYNLFGSKDSLVLETLRRQGEQIRASIEQRAAGHDDPQRRLVEVLQAHAEMLTSEGFHGCPLIIAAVQAPDSTETRELAHAHKVWLRGLLAQFARRAGLKSPEALASSLVLILEGAAAMSAVQPADLVAKQARAASRALIAAHTP